MGLGNSGDSTYRPTFTQVTTNINNNVKELLCFDNKTYIIKINDNIWVTGLMFNYSQTTFMQI